MELSFEGKHDRPWPNEPLKNEAIIGHTTANSARIWIRTRAPGKFWLALNVDPITTADDPRPVVATKLAKAQIECAMSCQGVDKLVPFETTLDADNTTVVSLLGLSPATLYYYAAFADSGPDRWEIGKEGGHRFRTTAASDVGAFGLFSCHMPYPDRDSIANMGMWKAFGEELTDAGATHLVGAGDQVYVDGHRDLSIWRWLRKVKRDMPESDADCVEIMKSWYRDIYKGYWGHLALREVFRRFPTYMIWDDHEIMDGWGSHTKEELSDLLDSLWEWENEGQNLRLANLMRKAAEAVYCEYEHSHNPPTDPGIYDYSFRQGPSAFYVLDMRGQRRFEPKKTQILGREQLGRLKRWLDQESEGTATALFIVSPVPVVHLCSFIVNHADIPALGLADDLRDEWEYRDHHKERNRLLQLVFDASSRKSKHIVFLSGDVHIGAAFRLSRRAHPHARVFQLTSSGITYYPRLGPLLRLGLRERGDLDGTTGRATTTFQLLQSFHRNNFGIVRVGRKPGAVEWDLYGRSETEGAVVRLERLSLE